MLEIILLVLSSLANMSLGLMVYLKNPRSATSRHFLLLTSSFTAWSIANSMSIHPTYFGQITWVRLVLFFAAQLSLSVYLTFTVFPSHVMLGGNRINKFLIISTGCVMALSLSPYMFKLDARHQPTPSFAIIIFGLLVIGLIGGGLYNLVIKYRHSTGLQKTQIQLLIVGLIGTFGLILINNFFLVVIFKIKTFIPLGPTFTLIFSGSLAYAIIRHRLFDIRAAIARSVAYVLSLSVVGLVYVVGIYIIFELILGKQENLSENIINIVLTLFSALTFTVSKKFFDKLTVKIFYRDSYNPEQLIDDLNDAIMSDVSLAALVQNSSNVVQNYLKSDFLALFLPNESRSGQRFIGYPSSNLSETTLNQLHNLIRNLPAGATVVDELEDKHQMPLKDLLQANNIAVVLQLTTRSIKSRRHKASDIGCIFIGYKRSGEVYNQQDIRVLNIIANELVIAIENVLRFEEIANFNITLREKVDEVSNDYANANRRMYYKNLELAKINKTLTTLRDIDLIILQSEVTTFRKLANDISAAIMQTNSYQFVAILSLDRREDGQIVFQGWAVNQKYSKTPVANVLLKNLNKISVALDDTWLQDETKAKVIDLVDLAGNEPNVSKMPIVMQLASPQSGFSTLSMYTTKLKARGNAVGIMIVGFDELKPREDDANLLDRLSEPVGVALDNKLLYDENQHVLKRLSKANEKLIRLDETKDEFISITSHQLRTPLTSIKGYISMILDGDMGPIPDKQRDMLTQAYISSQRMVYLIADLLSLSRLRTGKFIIEKIPLNLSDIIKGEINQLIESVKDRNLTLDFHPPKDFPMLMFDENKIRQVIMNFLDNAIHYTPQGGSIHISLSETERMIELKVTDTGMGVAREDQPHLFTKFFRAKNAQKARPDGTGLGLYMAKKVIINQGGAIIFNSKKGEGSTFGFKFEKARILPPSNKTQEHGLTLNNI